MCNNQLSANAQEGIVQLLYIKAIYIVNISASSLHNSNNLHRDILSLE